MAHERFDSKRWKHRVHHGKVSGAQFNSLPDLTITLIMHYLPMESLLDFSSICRRFRPLLTCYHVLQSCLPGVSIVPDPTLFRPFFDYVEEEVHPRTLYEQKTLLLFAMLHQMGYSISSSYLEQMENQPQTAKEWIQSLDTGMSMHHMSFFVALLEHMIKDAIVQENYLLHKRFRDPALSDKPTVVRLDSCLAAIDRKGIFCSLPITELSVMLLDSLGTETEYTLTELSDYYSLYSGQPQVSEPHEVVDTAAMALSHYMVHSYNVHAQSSQEQLMAIKTDDLQSIDVYDDEQDIDDLFSMDGPRSVINPSDIEKESYELSFHASVQNQRILQSIQSKQSQMEDEIPEDDSACHAFQKLIRDISRHLGTEMVVSRSMMRLLQDLVEGIHYGTVFLECKVRTSPSSDSGPHGDTFYPDGEFDALVLMGENEVIVRSVHKLIDGGLYDCMSEILEQRHPKEDEDESYKYMDEDDVVAESEDWQD